MAEATRDASRLTLPIVMVGSMLAIAGTGAWWASALTSEVSEMKKSLERIEGGLALTGVAANDLRRLTDLLGERQDGQRDRMNDIGTRLLRLEDWQRAVNARPTPPQ